MLGWHWPDEARTYKDCKCKGADWQQGGHRNWVAWFCDSGFDDEALWESRHGIIRSQWTISSQSVFIESCKAFRWWYSQVVLDYNKTRRAWDLNFGVLRDNGKFFMVFGFAGANVFWFVMPMLAFLLRLQVPKDLFSGY